MARPRPVSRLVVGALLLVLVALVMPSSLAITLLKHKHHTSSPQDLKAAEAAFEKTEAMIAKEEKNDPDAAGAHADFPETSEDAANNVEGGHVKEEGATEAPTGTESPAEKEAHDEGVPAEDPEAEEAAAEEHSVGPADPEPTVEPTGFTEDDIQDAHGDKIGAGRGEDDEEVDETAAEEIPKHIDPEGADEESDVDATGQATMAATESPKSATTLSPVEEAELDIAYHMVSDIKHLDPWLDPKNPDRVHVICVFSGVCLIIFCVGCCVGKKCQ